MPRHKTHRNLFQRLLYGRAKLLGILLIFILLAGGWALEHYSTKAPNIPTNGNPTMPTKPYVNLSPPTSQDKQDAQNHKQELLNNNGSTAPTNAGGKKVVTVVVTTATPTTINGYVTGVFEDGGTCLAKITNATSGQVVSLTSQGFENASYTSCTPMHPNLSAGNWSVVLSYSSATAEGSSNTVKVQ